MRLEGDSSKHADRPANAREAATAALTPAAVFAEEALVNQVLNVTKCGIGRALLDRGPLARRQFALETVQQAVQHVALPVIDPCGGGPFPEFRFVEHGGENGFSSAEG